MTSKEGVRVRGQRTPVLVLSSLLLLLCWLRWGPMDPLFIKPLSTALYDRDGRLLSAITASDGQWRFAPGAHVPGRLIVCLTQFEDRSYFQHRGVRPESLVRAFEQNRKAGRTVSGGSTLTMQVARLSRGGKRTYSNKLIEALLALWIEIRYDKSTILSMYAANAPFGGNVVGLEAAAWRWFGRSPEQLSWTDCATLAVLPNAPSDIYPGKGHDALRAKRNRLLDRLLAVHVIDRTDWKLACDEPLPSKPHALPRSAPHLLTTLMKHRHAGERIRTTINGQLQARATEVSERYSERLRANEVYNAAALIVDVPSGQVLAYVGNLPSAGMDHAGTVDIVRSQRSTGSLLKPFLYADMLQSGELLPDMLVADVPTRYDGFSPRNFDESYSGAVPASEALSRSLNVPAVRALRKHGVDRTLRTLHAMGFQSINASPDHYGLSLIVGGAESSLWELAGAYASMGRILRDHGRLGRAYQPGDVHALMVTEGESSADTSTRVPLTAASIHFTLKALREVNRPEAEQGWKAFADRQHIAWKTGTSVGHRDAWAIGLSDHWCVAVWTGNASGEGRPGLTGTLAAAPLMFDLFGLLPADAAPDPPFDELVQAPLCRASGHLAGIDCPVVDTVDIPREGLRTPACPYHLLLHVDASELSRVNAFEGHAVSWFHLPPAMERYYLPRHPGYRALPPVLNAGGEDAIMEVLYPEAGARLLIPTELDGTRGKAIIEVAHRDPEAVLHWDLDGTYLGHTNREHRMALDPPEGTHQLTLTDQNGNVLRHTFTVVGRERDR